MKTANRRTFLKAAGCASAGLLFSAVGHGSPETAARPNIILIMTDDQGWGQTGYYNHPLLKTPNLDAMAANGLRFDRFYAGAPVCSPTRATVLTGRTNDRCGVNAHGYALRLQEKTLPTALKEAGYATGHFGKWHLNGLRGPGIPILGEDDHNPGAFGFDEWVSVTNFFDRNPLMSRKGVFEQFEGDSSSVIVNEALRFIESTKQSGKPFFTVIWDGSPHSPWDASEKDREAFQSLDRNSQHHYGELVAFDRSVGTLRKGLRDLGIADNTLVWYCSDNGGLSKITPETTGGLRGNKASVWEGGLRVPCVIEWPAFIRPRVTSYPAATLDIFPTLAQLLTLPGAALLEPTDGSSLTSLFDRDLTSREKPIPFRFRELGALIDNDYKIVATDIQQGAFELYNLKYDPKETTDISQDKPEVFNRMKSLFLEWNTSVEASVAGKDYPEGKVRDGEPEPREWKDDDRYMKALDAWNKENRRL